MDYSILYLIGMIVFVVALGVFTRKLAFKQIITNEQLLFVAKAFDLTINLIDELNLKNEKKILEIADVVNDSIEFAIAINTDPTTMETEAYKHAIELANVFELELTENRINIMTSLINIGLNNKLTKDFIEK